MGSKREPLQNIKGTKLVLEEADFELEEVEKVKTEIK